MKQFKLVLVRETWDHMEVHSGFDPLFKHIHSISPNNSISIHVSEFQKKESLLNRIIKKLTNLISVRVESVIKDYRTTSPFVQRKHELTARLVIAELMKCENSIALLSVAENQYANEYINLPDHLKKRMVLFVHQPAAWFKLFWRLNDEFEKVAAVVCLSSGQYEFFKGIGVKNVIRIFHGVELDFFKPPIMTSKSFKVKLLFVGSWLRDIDLLYQSFVELNKKIENLELFCVVPIKDRNNLNFIKLAKFNNVFWYSEIDSVELRNLYYQSTILFLPLIDSTANNAINEAMACGLPVVTSDSGGVRDYLSSDIAYFCLPGNVEDHVNGVLETIQIARKSTELSLQIRRKAEENLNWNQIAETLLNDLNVHF